MNAEPKVASEITRGQALSDAKPQSCGGW